MSLIPGATIHTFSGAPKRGFVGISITSELPGTERGTSGSSRSHPLVLSITSSTTRVGWSNACVQASDTSCPRLSGAPHSTSQGKLSYEGSTHVWNHIKRVSDGLQVFLPGPHQEIHQPPAPSPHSLQRRLLSLLAMLFSTPLVVTVLFAISSAHALALSGRQGDCSFICPQADVNGNDLSFSNNVGDTSFSCTYSGALENPCTFDQVGVRDVQTAALTDLPLVVLWCAGPRQLG